MIGHRSYLALNLRQCSASKIKASNLTPSRDILLRQLKSFTNLADSWTDDVEY